MKKQNAIKLKSITISGFKSFNSDEHTIEFGDVSVLIGANGAGKSNVVSFFKMLNSIGNNSLQQHVGLHGGAFLLLHYGPKKTPKLSANLEFDTELGRADYEFSLVHAIPEKLIFEDEKLIRYIEDKKTVLDLPLTGAKESCLDEITNTSPAFPNHEIISFFKECKTYQFQDTTTSSSIRNSGYINQNEILYSEGANLAAFLYGLKENENYKWYYERIVRHIKRAFPQFGDFALLDTGNNNISLDWFEQGNAEYKLGAHQLSDGTIRFMALAALLLQPPPNLPSVVVLDEPELGLHPSAIIELASMVKMASQHTQVVLATQSPALLDEFDPEQITVIERDPISKSSILKRFSNEELKVWLEDYTLSEIWDKNILGGKP